MANVESEIKTHFAPPDASLPQDVLTELVHIVQLMGISAEDLYYKWDSYVITMGAETTKLDYKTIRDFKKSLQDTLERESRKGNVTHAATKRTAATPRVGASGGDVFGMLDGMVSNTPAARNSMAKRKANFDTPTSKSARSGLHSSPADGKTPGTGAARNLPTVAFADRQNAGDVIESINSHLPAAAVPEVPPTEARIRLKAATDLPKFAYKPMAMKLSEASEFLDDRIDSFMEVVQKHYELEDSAFGNPAAQSTAEIVAVGRIACDPSEGKLTSTNMVLETSRRMGAGLRVPLKFAENVSFDVFPGKIVALRGTNVGGQSFLASEVLPLPSLPPAAHRPSDIEVCNDRLVGADGETRPLNMVIASGPFTQENDLSFAPLQALLDKAEAETADLLLLTGPFLDLEHPVVASGDFEPYLPSDAKISPDQATITDVFRVLIGQPLQKLAAAVPSITIVLVPSLRDAVSKHVAWPQDRVPKAQLGLPRQAQFVANPMALSINEILLGVSSQDVLSELRRENVYQAAKGAMHSDIMGRLAGHVIEQSHYFPVFPPASREDLPKPIGIHEEVPEVGGEERLALGANLDLTYLKLGEFWQARPDLLILPGVLNPFVKACISASQMRT
ncbi:related to POL12 (DNA-directed DNA polymerase alpha) [Ramularia collo-cygni]|uniref:DNA polymerase alpha subunit B n=1 Tax=Ramularia collo-cygni TaxID=112498 RepID=A0A2D3URR0_9PEZI|nr:related to POL12 (DNA-directed DNA polymerase alpha) [Ramularia collo-cygni]CZT18761.1 related to POL12 (DNA-directed DNA polymerase alpha) [Ramularia collo-cygni]